MSKEGVCVADELLTVPEAARLLGVKERTVRRWVLLRRITYVKIGAAVRIPESEIARIIEEGTRPRIPAGSFSMPASTAPRAGP